MHVWITNPFDNLPQEGFRPQRYWLMARAFAAAGHDVVCWTSDFSHALKRRRSFVREESAPRVSLRLVPTLPYSKNVGLRRVASHLRLARTWRSLAAQEREKPDVVIASTPPLSLCRAAMDFAKGCNALFVADVMDAWPETFERVAPQWTLFPLRRAACRIYNGADAISAVASRYLDLAKSYGASAPMRLSYHGISMRGAPGGGREGGKGTCGGAAGIKVAYAGSFGASYDLETAIEAVKRMPEATLDLAGSGPKEAELRRLAEGCGRICFRGYLDGAALEAMLREADVGLVPMFPESCVGVPYKLADYAAAGLRVVECLGGETQEIVGRYRAGAHYAPRDAASLVAALREPLDPLRDAAGFAGEFDSGRIMSGYVRWIESLLA